MGNSQLDAIEEMALQNGTVVVNDAIEFTADIDAIYVSEDTIFTSIKVGGGDRKDDYITTSGSPIKAGVIIAPIRGVKFSGVQLVSGSVVVIRNS
tara:strand:+ start:12714 stop:12998 length:285 start_codon:yes stop_codon:yes gene_type:complete